MKCISEKLIWFNLVKRCLEKTLLLKFIFGVVLEVFEFLSLQRSASNINTSSSNMYTSSFRNSR